MIYDRDIRQIAILGLKGFIVPENICKILNVDFFQSIRLLKKAEALGLIEQRDDKNIWFNSYKGDQFALSNSEERYKESTIRDNLQKVIARAKEVNANGSYPFFVDQIYKIDLDGNLDSKGLRKPIYVVVKLSPKYQKANIEDAFNEFRKSSSLRHNNLVEYLRIPELATISYLKDRVHTAKFLKYGKSIITRFDCEVVYDRIDVK